jgi:hypothetical protein
MFYDDMISYKRRALVVTPPKLKCAPAVIPT